MALLEKFHQSGVDAVGLALHSDLVFGVRDGSFRVLEWIHSRLWSKSTAKLTLEKTLSLKLSLSPKIKSPFEFPPASGGACRCPGLGFGSGKLSAAEELRFRRFLSYLWGFDEDVERRRISTGALYSSGGGKAVLFLVLDGSLSLDLRIGRLGLVVRGSRRRRQESGSPLLSRCVYRWISLPRWRVGGSLCRFSVCLQYLFASDLLLVGSYYVDLRRRRSSLRSVPGFSFYCLCCGIRRFLAASVSVRRFSRSTSEAAVLMSLTTVFRSLVFAHIPASMGSLELLVVMCVTIVCSPRQAVLGRVIIFKSGSSGRPKLPGSDSQFNMALSFAASG
ncbi:hypothetical protein Bca4012_032547 [Brassica carinata]